VYLSSGNKRKVYKDKFSIIIMGKENLQEYPTLVDPFLDFEATRGHFGTGSCNYGIGEQRLTSGEILVYLNQQREGQKVVSTPTGFGRVCEQGVVICGYKARARGIFGFLRGSKVRTIPDAERQKVESELLQKLGDKKPLYIDFLSNFR
jgi:hypothetical protein